MDGDVRNMTVLSFGGEIWDRVIAGADLLALGKESSKQW
jgi:hypothetical protein